MSGKKKPEEKRIIGHTVRFSSVEDNRFWVAFGKWRMNNPKGSKVDFVLERCCDEK